MNAQFAIRGNDIFILEVNPRASRTIPFVAKATGVPLAKIAAKVMVGIDLVSQGYTEMVVPKHFSVKQPVFPFAKFQGVDPILGPEMKSTGEVMGIGSNFNEAYAKGQMGASIEMPKAGTAFVSVRDADKLKAVDVARRLVELGFDIVATRGTSKALENAGVPHQLVNKVEEGRPNIVDMIKNDEIALIINSTEGQQATKDSYSIRRNAVQRKVVYYTTVAGGRAACDAIIHNPIEKITRLQDL